MKKHINYLELLFIGTLVLGFFAFMLNNQRFNYFIILVLNFLLRMLIFSSLILILILTFRLTYYHIANYNKSFLRNIKKNLESLFPLTINKKEIFFLGLAFCFHFYFCILIFSD